MIVWILLERCCWLNPSLWIVDYSAFKLVMSFISCVPWGYVLLQDSKGQNSFSPHVLESPCISLDLRQGNTLSSDKDITLTSVCYHSQGIALLSTAGTPTPNGLRSSWGLQPRRSPDVLVAPTPSIDPSTFILIFVFPFLPCCCWGLLWYIYKKFQCFMYIYIRFFVFTNYFTNSHNLSLMVVSLGWEGGDIDKQ